MQQDEAYLDFLAAICERARRHGLYVFIDFHQDVWSRMSGGSGAPGWTFEAAGLDFTKFDRADAAHVMQYRYDSAKGGRQPAYPAMSWSANYQAPANAIMWTLFWGGDIFAPGFAPAGEPVQQILQRSYLDAMRSVAERVAHLPNVLGFDTLNEPGQGILCKRMNESKRAHSGLQWSPLDALAAASGHPRRLRVIDRETNEQGEQMINVDGVSIWRDGVVDPFLANGAWAVCDEKGPVATDEVYFCGGNSENLDFERDFLAPFFGRVAETVRSFNNDWLIFAEISPFTVATKKMVKKMQLPERTVNANHWYDYSALVTKSFDIDSMKDITTGATLTGRSEIKARYRETLEHVKAFADHALGGAPTLIGECGVPFDMEGGESFRQYAAGHHTQAIWRRQINALDLMYEVFDEMLLSSTQWNYTATNRNDLRIGDGWNQEDLSIYSVDQDKDCTDPDSGGRAIDGYSRPYIRAAQGRIVSQSYTLGSQRFTARIDADPEISAPTEIYVPLRIFGHHLVIDCPGAEWDYDPALQILFVRACHCARITLTIAAEAKAEGGALLAGNRGWNIKKVLLGGGLLALVAMAFFAGRPFFMAGEKGEPALIEPVFVVDPALAAVDAMTNTGMVRGHSMDGLHIFKGIPYAAPPTGDLRWRAPRDVAPWEGVRPAQSFGYDCMQNRLKTDPSRSNFAMSEDCLTVNIWTPSIRSDAPLPVMFWIHGGGFVTGGSTQGILDGAALARRGVVVATFNYRLGRFGFFAHPALTAEANGGPTGNFGVMDQIAALRWVRSNIAGFGGDPENITIFGESAGAASVGHMMCGDDTKGLFQRAIMQSPGGRLRWSTFGPDADGKPGAEQAGEAFVAKLQIEGDVLEKLRALEAETVLGEVSFSKLRSDIYSGPMIDGRLIKREFVECFENGEVSDAPLIIGTNSEELSHMPLIARFFILRGIKKGLKDYLPALKLAYGSTASLNDNMVNDWGFNEPARTIARGHHARGATAYLYSFDYVQTVRRPEFKGAPHASEVSFVFDTLGADGVDTTAEDNAVAARMQEAWSTFAKYAVPAVDSDEQLWRQYDPNNDEVLLISGNGAAMKPVERALALDAITVAMTP
jgi:carboxylesterase type B